MFSKFRNILDARHSPFSGRVPFGCCYALGLASLEILMTWSSFRSLLTSFSPGCVPLIDLFTLSSALESFVVSPPISTVMPCLEKYINSDDTLAPLIQAALIHYQFETIPPFFDGNGRVGRLLITLFLMEKGILSTPALYISYYLKINRIEYYDRMKQVRRAVG